MNCNNCCQCFWCRIKKCIRQIVREELSQIPTSSDTNGIQMQLANSPSLVMNNGDTIMFDSTIISNSPDITYSNGQFIINKSGNYNINFQITTDGSDVDTNLSFAITKNGVNYATIGGNIVTGQISGNVLINANVGDVISLVNASNQQIVLGANQIQANIVIS